MASFQPRHYNLSVEYVRWEYNIRNANKSWVKMPQDVELRVKDNGMYCPPWEGRIEVQLGRMPGVIKVNACYKNQTVQLSIDNEIISETTLRDKLSAMGFETE